MIRIIGDVLWFILRLFASIFVRAFRLIVPPALESVRGEIVLITGAGHGMGKELALLYASQGATVVCWDINGSTVKQTVKEIEKLGYTKAFSFVCDVSNRVNVLEVAKKVQQTVGRVTILVNNAGIMPTHLLLKHTPTEIEQIININILAHFWTLEAFLPAMLTHNRGHIVTLSSVAGLFGAVNVVPYCASKYAVRGLMDGLQRELRALGKSDAVKTTTIYPYMVDTGLCKRPRIRFRNIMPMIEAKAAAQRIVDAQRRGYDELSIPSYYLFLAGLERLLPRAVYHRGRDFLGVELESDL